MKNKNLTITLLSLVLLGVFVIFFVGERNGDDAKDKESALTPLYSSGVLEAVENNFDFGTILMQDGPVSKKFKIVNNGDEILKIGKVYTSCACTTASIIDESGKKYGKFGMPGHKGFRSIADVKVKPDESVVVEVVYDPAFHGPSGVGLAQRSIYIESNSTKSPKLELKFQAIVTR